MMRGLFVTACLAWAHPASACSTTLDQWEGEGLLRALGFSGIKFDGVATPEECEVVAALQRERALPVAEGALDPETLRSLRASADALVGRGPYDEDAADRAATCGAVRGRCLLVQQLQGTRRNVLELFESGAVTASAPVNTGRAASHASTRARRTRNGDFFIFDERDQSGRVTRAVEHRPSGWTVLPVAWTELRQAPSTHGLMGDPHYFHEGQALHWRVASAVVDGKRRPIARDGRPTENTEGWGGYRSLGCVHVPRAFLERFDADFFQVGVPVFVRDQPPDAPTPD